MVIRDYLVKNFKMDDTRLKTMGLGKKNDSNAAKAGGVDIIVYPVGATVPPDKQRLSANGAAAPPDKQRASANSSPAR
jgi:hypothetical protein